MIYIACMFFSVSLNFLLLYKLYRYSIFILKTEEALENSLDVLKEKYDNIDKILQKEIFFDSIEVRQVISDIRETHNALVYVSDVLTDEKNGLKIEIEEKKDS